MWVRIVRPRLNNESLRPVRAPACAEKSEIEQSKQSSGNHELLQDARASTPAGAVNPQMETLGEIERAEIDRR
jgi:hypothetical protein